MAVFRDRTGRPGPSTWELASFPEGHEDHPVSGVSWFEAAAYARFAGRALPTVHHWRKASGLGYVADLLVLSNVESAGTVPVGTRQALSAFGAYDMAGNVKEWCWNASGDRRYILGGGWNETSYAFADSDARSPWDRGPANGLRTARYSAPLPAAQVAPVAAEADRDYVREKPVSDEVFSIYRRLHAYDRSPLEAAVEAVVDEEHWRREKVSFTAAYGQDRIPAYLYLPRTSRPPYQAVVYVPGAEAFSVASAADARMRNTAFLVRSGRAVILPAYQGTFERRLPRPATGPHEERDMLIQMSKDVGRTVDYLQSRPDIDPERVAYYGVSVGSTLAPLFLATEPRLRVAALQAASFDYWNPEPEVDPFHYAPRVKVPVLVLNGRYDFTTPLETMQRPYFLRLGTPSRDKRLVLSNTGHASFPVHELAREVLDWFDHYLGPVR
jgi:dienelactone hydrolase